MVTWPEAVDRIAHAQADTLDIHHRRFGGFSRTPLIIAGNPGAGKTRIWCRLTGRSRPDAASLTTDDGYMLSPQKRTLTLTTIPGQVSRGRYYALEEFFGPKTRVKGIIFVACYGRDRIWQQNADLVANDLPTFDAASLIERNKREERENFRDIVDRIIQKHFIVERPEFRPEWLLVVANKLDLYWDERDQALAYYRPGGGSQFDDIAQELLRRLGTSALSYFVMPLATEPSAYRFDSSRGRLEQLNQLSGEQCSESVACFVETLGGLCD